MPRETLQDDDVIYHETFDARAKITNVDNGQADLEWQSGDLEDRIWPATSLTALQRGVGETIEIINRGGSDPDPSDGHEEKQPPTDDSKASGWIDRTIRCPDCNQFSKSGLTADGRPYAECSRCGWKGDPSYLIEQGFYATD